MGSRFFKPFVGENYEKGINGKKVLVLGASFYCKEMSCKYFEECTSVDKKDSSPFDARCPLVDYNLSDEPWNEIESICDEGTYKKFANEMMKFTGTSTSKDTWDCFAFTNYVQFFLPGEEGKFRPTLRGDLSERDYEAFNETLRELKPDIVIVWGSVFSSRIMRDNEYLVYENELEESEGYLCHIKLPDMEKQVTLVNPYHPSSSAWYSNIEKFEFYFEKAIKSAGFKSLSEEALSIVQTFANTHNGEYKKLVVSLYATMPNANKKMLQALEEYFVDLNSELTKEEMDILRKDYKAVVRHCYGKDRDGVMDDKPTHWLPRTLIDLCISIMKPKRGGEILLPYAGDAQIAHALPECSFDGYESDSKIWAYSQIVCDAFSANAKIQFGNFKDSVDEKTYDYVFSCPLGRDLRTIVDDDIARNRLKTNGVMCCILPISFCDPAASDWIDWYDLRAVLSKKHPTYNAEIISLPGLHWTRNKENLCVLFLTKNDKNDITKNDIALVNATGIDFYNRGCGRVSGGIAEYPLKVQSVVAARLRKDKKYGVWFGHSSALERIKVSKDEEDFNLLPKRYIVQQYLPNPSKGERRVKLGEILEVVSPQPEYFDFNGVRSLSSQDLYDDPLNCDVLYNCVIGGGYGVTKVIAEKCILVGYVNGRFKVGRAIDFSNENPVGLRGDVIPLRIKNLVSVSEDFVLMNIMSELVLQQAEVLFEWENRLYDEDFLQIEILVPSKEEQERMYKENIRQQFADEKRKLQETLEEFANDVRMKKHAIGQTIFALNNWWNLLQWAREEGEGVLVDTNTISSKKIPVAEIYTCIKTTIGILQKQITHFDLGDDFVSDDEINLSEFIENYKKNHPHTYFMYNVINHLTDVNNLFEYVKFPNRALERIFDNIINNAESHGFKNRETGNNVIRIELAAEGFDRTITISNNGHPLPENISIEDIFMYAKGSCIGEEHSGIGGYDIRRLMRDFGGDVQIISSPNDEFPVSYKLIFHKSYPNMKKFVETGFRMFDPLTDGRDKLPDVSGNYIFVLRKGAHLPETKIVPITKNLEYGDDKYAVIYTGMSKDSLQRRVYDNHFVRNDSSRSTLRKSFGRLMGMKETFRDKNETDNGKTKFIKPDEEKLSEWMRSNLLLFYYSSPISVIEDLEQELIDFYNPPLNLKGNDNPENSSYRRALGELRR